MSKIGIVVSSAPATISVEMSDLQVLEENKADLQPGKYLKIEDGNHNFAIGLIRNLRATHEELEGVDVWRIVIDCTPIGALLAVGDGYEFRRGTSVLPVPTEAVHTLDASALEAIFASNDEGAFEFGAVASSPATKFVMNGDRLFGKHLAVVGSTGSGKSCAVAHLLQTVVGIKDGVYALEGNQNNAHIVVFDLHAEYASAFKLNAPNNFTLNELTADKIALPYWLMNAEELETLFIESNEANSHNQVSMFKRAVILNKRSHNPLLAQVTYDTPCYFSIQEVVCFIDNVNREVVGKLDGEGVPKLADGTLVNDVSAYFSKQHEFVSSSTAGATKASNGPFHGEFNRFVSRLETALTDDRLQFLLNPKKEDGTPFITDDFGDIIRQFTGYLNRANITIVDLSGVPFEVLSVTVSLVSRLIFDFCFHYSKLRHAVGEQNDVPMLLVCEEAHNYVPASDAQAYRASRKSIERVAKEGRKYGLGLMIVSQRPSEVSSTIFAQCNNFIALRLTNAADQSYIRGLLPDDGNGITDVLPMLPPGEAVIVGDAVLLPTIVCIPLPSPQPDSATVKTHTEWKCSWRDPAFENVVSRWRKEEVQS